MVLPAALLGLQGGPDTASASQANLKQIGQAIAMYVEDNGGYPMHSSVHVSPQSRWPDRLIIYVKTESVFVAPGAEPDLVTRTWVHTALAKSPRKYGGYGYNYQYLGNSRDPSPQEPNLPFAAKPGSIAEPALTVMVGDTTGAKREDGSFGGVYVLDPPLGSERGSGRGLFYDEGSMPQNRSKPAPRHQGFAAILFVDGHVKLLTPRQLDDSNGDGRPDNGFWNGYNDAAARR